MLTALTLLGCAAHAVAAPGDLDMTFNGTGTVVTPVASSGSEASAIVRQLDGKLVAAGFAFNGSNLDFALVRYDASGGLDPSFGGGTGKVTTAIGPGDDEIRALIQQADGKLVAAGLSYNATFDTSTMTVVRYLDDGTPDPAFGGGTGKVTTAITTEFDGALALIQQTDGKLVVAGYGAADIALVRYETDGDLDMTFNGTGKVTTTVGNAATALALLQQAGDGKLVIAGSADADIVLVRYDTGGTPDPMFDGDGIVTTPAGTGNAEARALIRQAADGKLVVAGVSSNASDTDVTLVRYEVGGGIDTNFGTLGIVTTPIGSGDDEAFALAQQDDGKLVVAGSTSAGLNNFDIALVRYDATGTPDPGFGTGGVVKTPVGTGDDKALALLIQPNGGIVVAGSTRVPPNTTNFVVARYLSLTGTTSTSTITTTTGATTTNVVTTTVPGSTTTTLPATRLVPGGPPTKTSNDCYLELQFRGIGASQVQKNQIVSCADGDPCDQGPCGDDRCDVEVAACASQTDPSLPNCTAPASLDSVKLSGALAGSAGGLLAGPACSAPTQLQVPVKFTKRGTYKAAKSKVVVKGSAKAPKGTPSRKDKDKWTVQCMPPAGACAP